MGLLNRQKSGAMWLDKKAQLQIQETILVVFIFIVLIMLGLIFFYRVQSGSIAQEFHEFQVSQLGVDFVTIGDLAEFSCSKAGIRESCIDSGKLVIFSVLSKVTTESYDYEEYYFERFGYKNITIFEVYPGDSREKCTINNVGAECGVWEVYVNKPDKIKSKRIFDTPVSLYFPERDEYGIGLLVVEAYNV